MVNGKHISLEDMADIFENERNGFADEEKMLVLLQHLAVCSECRERVKAHRRLDILLNNWSPSLQGQAYKKMEYLKQLKENKKADNENDRNNGKAGDAHSESCGCGHNHAHDDCDNDYGCDDDCDCDDGCGDDYDCYNDCDDGCDCDNDYGCDDDNDCGCGYDQQHDHDGN